jgi:cytochrome c2
VAGASPAVEIPVEARVSVPAQWPQWLVGLLGTSAILVGLVLALRKKARWAIALVLAGLVVGAGSIVSAAEQAGAESNSASQMNAQDAGKLSSISQVELGRQLFVAKGCMVCHSHSETNKIRTYGVDIGPDLTNITASPEYLRMWLTNPLGVKSTATMPTLGLSDAEIEALIAFINAD